jgi:hypothetical protein
MNRILIEASSGLYFVSGMGLDNQTLAVAALNSQP